MVCPLSSLRMTARMSLEIWGLSELRDLPSAPVVLAACTRARVCLCARTHLSQRALPVSEHRHARTLECVHVLAQSRHHIGVHLTITGCWLCTPYCVLYNMALALALGSDI